jgi:hypothetical protein
MALDGLPDFAEKPKPRPKSKMPARTYTVAEARQMTAQDFCGCGLRLDAHNTSDTVMTWHDNWALQRSVVGSQVEAVACDLFDPKDSLLRICHCGFRRREHADAAVEAWMAALTQQLGRIK